MMNSAHWSVFPFLLGKCLRWRDLPWMIIAVLYRSVEPEEMANCGGTDLITHPEVEKVEVAWNKCKENMTTGLWRATERLQYFSRGIQFSRMICGNEGECLNNKRGNVKKKNHNYFKVIYMYFYNSEL